MTNKQVFLDLEQTIISVWGDPVLANVPFIKEFLQKEEVTNVTIFSFACRHEADRTHFNETMREWLEDCFGFTIDHIYTVEEIAKIVRQENKRDFHIHDIISLWGKQRSFEDVVLNKNARNKEFILVDDVVPNKTVFFEDSGVKIRFVNC